MGYDAYVTCNCYKGGKVKVPDFGKYLRETVEGLELDLPNEIVSNKELEYSMYDRFDAWLETACPHPNMQICAERLANISGMEDFRNAVENAGGADVFPVLTQYLPKLNGGNVPNEHIIPMKQEVEAFERMTTSSVSTLLRIYDKKVLQTAVDPKEKWIFFSPYNQMFIRNGWFIVREQDVTVFQARHLKVVKEDSVFLLTNQDTNEVCEVKAFLDSDIDKRTIDLEYEVRQFEVSNRSNFEYIIKPLLRLADAAMESGNPIVWC